MPVRRPPERIARRKPFIELLEKTHEQQPVRDLNFAHAFLGKVVNLKRRGVRRDAAVACLVFLNAKNYERAWGAFERLKKIEAATIGRADYTEGTSERIHPVDENLFGAIAALKTGKRERFQELIQTVFEFLPEEPKTNADREILREVLALASEHEVFGEVMAIFKAWQKMSKK